MPRLSVLLRLPIVLLLAHLYVATRLAAAVSPTVSGVVLTLFVLIYCLILFGFFTRRSERHHVADLTSWVGFICLGLFSWLFVLTVLRDLFLVLAYTVAYVADDPLPNRLRIYSAALVAVVSLVAVVIGLAYARRRAPVVEVEVPIVGLPADLAGVSLVQITDLHVGPTIKHGYVTAVVNAVNRLNPDIIALTGDLVDGSVEDLAEHVEPLRRLQARHGVFAVTGNHEYYSGAQQWIDAYRGLGMNVLMNQHVALSLGDATLVVAGVTDFTAGHYESEHASDPRKALAGAPDDAALKILLAHQPRSALKGAAAGFDLQVSGHTHGGQFWPWKYFVPLQQPYVAGLYRHESMWVYVSRGTGYWGPPMRVGAPSEITRIRLVKSENPGVRFEAART